MAKIKNRKNRTGWARTKKTPHENHPAFFKRDNRDSDRIKYVTFTHSQEVNLEGAVIKTIKLNNNISNSPKEEGRDTYVFPRVYEGKRSSLGGNASEFKFSSSEDKNLIHNMIDTMPTIKINYISNSSSKNKKKK